MRATLFIALLASAVTASADTSVDTTVVLRQDIEETAMSRMLNLVPDNPALQQLPYHVSLSAVTASYHYRNDRYAIDPREGQREQYFGFNAESRIFRNRHTIWGHASYLNGTVRSMQWNQTSDLAIVRPYAMGDAGTSARLKEECYSFAGGYAGTRGKWLLGAQLAFKAGLYYRNVDPRPRNVTADLDIRVGAGYCLSTHVISVGVGYERYKQTNDIKFYSEMGNDKVYHFTGFANDYARFGGTGYSTHYRGGTWRITAGFNPLRLAGWHVNATLSRLSIDNIITSLSKLPLAKATENSAHGEVAYIADRWAVKAHTTAARRVGTENIFGDAASSVYPVIGSLDMYHENRFEAGWQGRYSGQLRRIGYTLALSNSYRHHNATYADPQSWEQINDLWNELSLRLAIGTKRSLTSLRATLTGIFNLSDKLTLGGTKPEMLALQSIIEDKHANLANHHGAIGVSAGHTHVVNKAGTIALQGTVSYNHEFYKNTHRDIVSVSLGVIF